MNRNRRNKVFLVLLVVLFCTMGFVGCSTYCEEVYKVSEDFRAIEIDDTEAGIIISPSSDGKCKVVIDEKRNGSVYHTVKVDDGVLKIDRHTKGINWIFGGSIGELLVEVYLPKKEYDDLSVSSVNGRIDVERGFVFGNVDLNTTSGRVKFSSLAKDEITIFSTSGSVTVESSSSLKNIDCRSVSGIVSITDVKADRVYAKSTSGSVSLDSVVASDTLTLNTVSGTIRLDRCDGGDVYLESSSGSIKGSLLSGKNFKAKSSTGRVDVPLSSGLGVCEARTTSGSIVLSVV